MQIQMCHAKLHRVTVTDANLNYKGSVTIGKNLLIASGIRPFQMVHLNNLANAGHWETYVIAGEENEICLNGCPARLFQVGDKVVILGIVLCSPVDLANFRHSVVYVDHENSIISVEQEVYNGC